VQTPATQAARRSVHCWAHGPAPVQKEEPQSVHIGGSPRQTVPSGSGQFSRSMTVPDGHTPAAQMPEGQRRERMPMQPAPGGALQVDQRLHGGPHRMPSLVKGQGSVVVVSSSTQAPERHVGVVVITTRVPAVGHGAGTGAQVPGTVVTVPHDVPSVTRGVHATVAGVPTHAPTMHS
jgi:hypothetical protein